MTTERTSEFRIPLAEDEVAQYQEMIGGVVDEAKKTRREYTAKYRAPLAEQYPLVQRLRTLHRLRMALVADLGDQNK